jgi:4-hydroxy-3-polyprenylbenzoate decarboxylase
MPGSTPSAAVSQNEGLIRPYKDLRDWLGIVGEMGELKIVHGADPDLEIAAITELVRLESTEKPALLFDQIKGYPPGYRVLTGIINTIRRLALMANMPVEENVEIFVRRWKDRLKELRPIPPRYVQDGPILENIKADGAIDLRQFPTPIWHERDGGRYIGTAGVTITTDPKREWVNLGTYRNMIHDSDVVGFYASPGKHGRIHREMFWREGKACPVVVTFGQDPVLFHAASSFDVPSGASELELAGAIKGEPIEVIRGEVTGLPIPVHAEIAIEGECPADERVQEGPFGEFTGYYASGARPEPIIRVKRLYYRNDPIITGCPPARPPAESTFARSPLKSAAVWNVLEKTGLTGLRGVCMHPVGATYFFTVVSIKQAYAGHAKQAGTLAASVRGAGYMARFVIVVDEDIDPFKLEDVLWALGTRCHPDRDIDILKRTWSGPLDPMIPAGAPNHGSVAVIDATKPWEWKEEFPPAITFDEGFMRETRQKWAKLLGL